MAPKKVASRVKRLTGELSQGGEEAPRPSKKPAYPSIGKATFFNEECLDKYLTLSSTKPLAIRPIDVEEFGEDLSPETLFKFQGLLSFLIPTYRIHYPTVVKEFYANLFEMDSEKGLKYKSMVKGIPLSLQEHDLNEILRGDEEVGIEIDNDALIDLFHPEVANRIGY